MRTVRKTIELEQDLVDWVETRYGGKSLTWTLNLLLAEYKAAHSISPKDYAAIGAAILMGKITNSDYDDD